MQLTRAADYAIRVMIHLAALEPGARASRTDLAAAAECPEPFLAKVLQSLAKARLITSYRGNTGGFQLPDESRSATMLQIVEAVEGPIRLNVCLDPGGRCNRRYGCPAHRVWALAQEAMTSVLRGVTLDQLAQDTNACLWT